LKNIVKLTLFIAFLGSSLFGGKLSIATGLEDGFYNKYGKEIIKQCSNKFKLSLTENISTSGSSENIRKLLDREVDFAIVQLDTLHFFRDNFDSKLNEKIKVIAPLFYENIFLITKDTNIKQYSDLGNKKVLINSYRSGGYTTYLNFKKSLELNWEAVESEKDFVYDFKNKDDIRGLFFVSKSTEENLSYNDDLREYSILKINPDLYLNQHLYLNQLYKYDFDNNLYQIPALLVASKTAKKEDIQRLQSCIEQENLSELDEKVNWTFFNYESSETAEKEYQFFTELKSNKELFNINHKNGQGKSLLTLAVENNQLEKVKELLDTDIDINAQDIHENTALHYLFQKSDSDEVLNQKIELLKIFISKKAKLNIQNKKLETPVFEWIRNINAQQKDKKDEFVLKLFEDKTLKFYEHLKPNSYGNNILHFAFYYDLPKFAKYLIEQDIKKQILNSSNIDGDTPFNFYVQYASMSLKNFDMYKFLLSNNSDFNKKYNFFNQQETEFIPIFFSPFFFLTTEKLKSLFNKKEKKGFNNINQKYFGGWTPLMMAVITDRLDLVKFLVENGADIETTNEVNLTALTIASEKGHLDIVKYLVKNGADLNKEGKYGYSALMFATEGHLEIIKYLVKNGADINKEDKNGYSALIFASAEGRLEIVKYLVENGADLNKEGKDGLSALIIASQNGHLDIVKYLVENGANINKGNKNGYSALMIASRENYLDIVKYLVKNGADINKQEKDGYSALMIASLNNYLDIVKYLVKNGADINKQEKNGYSALIIASKNGYFSIVKHLVENGADINKEAKNRFSALIIASQNAHLNIVKYLVENGADINKEEKNGVSALIIASQNGHLDIVKYLVKNGADINKEAKNGYSALIIASQNGHLDIVKHLVENGADINKEAKNRFSALMFASLKNNLEIVKYLVKSGVDIKQQGFSALRIAFLKGHFDIVKYLVENINKGTKDGFSALMLASRQGGLDIVKYLVKNGADINKRTKDGFSALMLASHQGHLDIVKYLVENGANVNKGNKKGVFALMYASVYGHLDIVKLLVENGADINKEEKDGVSALILASKKGYLDIVKYLVKNGAKITKSSIDKAKNNEIREFLQQNFK
jgi:ankyrin repeat protein